MRRIAEERGYRGGSHRNRDLSGEKNGRSIGAFASGLWLILRGSIVMVGLAAKDALDEIWNECHRS
jgi:hypothetical protein